MANETVEEFLARGGKITKVPTGAAGERIVLTRRQGSNGRVDYSPAKPHRFNNKAR